MNNSKYSRYWPTIYELVSSFEVVFIVISYVFFFFTSFPTYGIVIQWTLCLSINYLNLTLCLSINYLNFTGPVPCHITILIKFRMSSSNMNFQVNFCFSSIITFFTIIQWNFKYFQSGSLKFWYAFLLCELLYVWI